MAIGSIDLRRQEQRSLDIGVCDIDISANVEQYYQELGGSPEWSPDVPVSMPASTASRPADDVRSMCDEKLHTVCSSRRRVT